MTLTSWRIMRMPANIASPTITLTEIILQRIKSEGPISFRDFMEMALYYPEQGYYTSPRNKIGTSGDFYTSSNLTAVFGATIGRQLEEMWKLSGKNAFTVVEYGAGTGLLCYDILSYLKNNQQLYERLNYYIIEKSPAMRQNEQIHLSEKVQWVDSINEIGNITGCIISNELVDNFSVHRVVMQQELMEVYVGYEDGFVELLRPASADIINYLAELNVVLPPGFATEINLEATAWIKELAASLTKGYVITIDYGYLSDELYHTSRSQGTLMCYKSHQINDNPYHAIGEQDITSHVNFSALCHWGTKKDLQTCGFTNQAHFLLALGFKGNNNSKQELQEQSILQIAMKEAYLTRMLLVEMGNKFKVLIQQKGLPRHQLEGLKFSHRKYL